MRNGDLILVLTFMFILLFFCWETEQIPVTTINPAPTESWKCDRNFVQITSLSIAVVQLLSHVCLFCNPMDSSPPGSSILGTSQARILEWVAISFFRGSNLHLLHWQADSSFDRVIGCYIKVCVFHSHSSSFLFYTL